MTDARRTWDWQPPTRVQCLRCAEWFETRELTPRCPACGFKETLE
jgi:hypothetical protein